MNQVFLNVIKITIYVNSAFYVTVAVMKQQQLLPCQVTVVRVQAVKVVLQMCHKIERMVMTQLLGAHRNSGRSAAALKCYTCISLQHFKAIWF